MCPLLMVRVVDPCASSWWLGWLIHVPLTGGYGGWFVCPLLMVREVGPCAHYWLGCLVHVPLTDGYGG